MIKAKVAVLEGRLLSSQSK